MRKKVEASPSPLPVDVAVESLSRSDEGAYYPRPIALKKKRKERCPLSALPYELALSCMARVRRCDHPSLSLVSKSYRSLVASPELHKIRSTMGITDTEAYVCLRNPPDPNPRWFILRRSSSLVPIASNFPSQHLESCVVALGSAIYVIGGRLRGIPTRDVWRLDCRTHTWHRVPSMGVARASAAASVVDGMIYVVGGFSDDDDDDDDDPSSCCWGEVFDPKTQAWESLPWPGTRHGCYLHDCVVKDGKIYAVNGVEKTHYYSPREGNWGLGNRGVVAGGPRRDWCMIGNLIYSIDKHGRIFWCEQEELDMREPPEEGIIMDWWNEVKGLEALTGTGNLLSRSRLVHFGVEIVNDYYKHQLSENKELAALLPGARLCTSAGGNNILLFWDHMVGGRIQQIWCAEISLERRGQAEIWGNIEWSHPVIKLDDNDPFARPRSCKLLHSVSVTI